MKKLKNAIWTSKPQNIKKIRPLYSDDVPSRLGPAKIDVVHHWANSTPPVKVGLKLINICLTQRKHHCKRAKQRQKSNHKQ